MTSAPSTLVALQNKLSANLHTTNLGIVGDAAHVAEGGYHIGAQSLRANGMSRNYSLEFAADNRANHDWSCAIDIGGPMSLLQTLGDRLVHALQTHDPRVWNKVRAVNAPFGGQTNDRRFDTEDPTVPLDDSLQPSSDQGHIHVEFYRTLVLDQSVMDGFYSVISGQGNEDDMSAAAEAMIKDLHDRLSKIDIMAYQIATQVTPAVAATRGYAMQIAAKVDALSTGGTVDPKALAADLIAVLPADLAQQVVNELSARLAEKPATP